MRSSISAEEQAVIRDVLHGINTLLGEEGRPADFDPDAWTRELTDPVSPEFLYATRMLLGAWAHGNPRVDVRVTLTLARLGALQRTLATPAAPRPPALEEAGQVGL